MSPTPQLFRIKPDEKESDLVEEVDFSVVGLQEPRDIQKWVAKNPSILGDDLLIITEQFSDFDRTKERLDLLAVDTTGKLVIIELKRDDSGADVHWQAIKYASYLDRATSDDIARMLAAYEESSEEEAIAKIEDHLNANDLSTLNNGQRIILASHRFAREVTSAVLWLNEQTDTDLITCVQLTPYQDSETDSLYLLANTIIPVAGVETYRIQVGSEGSSGLTPTPSRASNLYTREINRVIGGAIDMADDAMRKKEEAEGDLVTEKYHRMGRWGYWSFWYSREPWAKWDLMYRIILQKKDLAQHWLISPDALNAIDGEWAAAVQLYANRRLPQSIEDAIDNLPVSTGHSLVAEDRMVLWGTDELTSEFTNELADAIRNLIETITPQIDEAYKQGRFDSVDADEEDSEEDN